MKQKYILPVMLVVGLVCLLPSKQPTISPLPDPLQAGKLAVQTPAIQTLGGVVASTQSVLIVQAATPATVSAAATDSPAPVATS